MEVFKRFPQKPPFHPLLKCKEACREGSALGKMVNFAFMVGRLPSCKLAILETYLIAFWRH
ncbi:unnamed protein product [Prunus armeniaca]|uniref:Uncharacterized protein n=1 Tax=Prunus armeniaca TaxID=36596 RepID=A0A6J5UAE1_PRUAR|nr:unnamed protein product [Prunus armeniaca]